MPRPRRRSTRSHSILQAGTKDIGDLDTQFISQKSLEYTGRLLQRFLIVDERLFKVVVWAWGRNISSLVKQLSVSIGPIGDDEDDDNNPFNVPDVPDALVAKFKLMSRSRLRRSIAILNELNESWRKRLLNRSLSGIEKAMASLKKAFSLTGTETELCGFVFLTGSFEELHDLFFDCLECQKLGRRHYLATALGMSGDELRKTLNGTLKRVGLIEVDKHEIEIKREFIQTILTNPSPAEFSKSFFLPVQMTHVPLESHFIDKAEIEYMRRLLSRRPKSSTQILLYGDPGTGKSSFANRLVQEIGVPSYDIVKGDENETMQKRNAILVCLEMTNHKEGSILIVDEADNVLNTRHSWLSRGETQDKGWLNQLLEKPGVRIIWITNEIEDIEPSVLRRFAHSVHFKKFGNRQRIQIWESVLRKYRVGALLKSSELEHLAREFRVSAGAVEIAVRKAVESGKPQKKEFLDTLKLTLKRHETLLNGGIEKIHKDQIEENYSIEGLKIVGDLPSILDDLGAFDSYLRGGENERRVNMNLLFYGPPGTGKSELARFVARRLDRELIVKKASDFLNPYVGMTEKYISEGFREAEREDAVLVIDEVDTMLFKRDRAQRSWEISQTNEFLTQMERFRGILICTTNRFEDLDAASVRRFNHKLEFRFLTSEGVLLFWERMLGHLSDKTLKEAERLEIMSLRDLCPGDFKMVRDRFIFRDPKETNPSILIEALRKEVNTKKIQSGEKRAGF